MWRSRLGLVAVLLGLPATAGRAAICLPPVFEGGARLHRVQNVDVHWLPLLLRQHQLCHEDATAVRRVVVLGNSAVYGHPLPVEETAWGQLNRRFERSELAIRVFNLGFSFAYQLKEALILREAVAYRPDLLVVGVSLSDFRHEVPVDYQPLARLFDANPGAVTAFAREEPPSLGEPLRRWSERYASPFGGLEAAFTDWQQWNLLAYLEAVSRERDVPVLIVNLPVAHEPRDECYNQRFPAVALDDYNAWLRTEARSRGLALLDLHDLLPAREFLDSIHPTASGHARVARVLEPEILRLLSAAPVVAPGR